MSVGLRAEKKENFKQSKVGARLSEITTKHAVALVMAMIIIVPFVVPTVNLKSPELTVKMLFELSCR